MKIWSVKTTIYSLESIVVKSFKSSFCQQHLQLSLRQVAFQLVELIIYVRNPNLHLTINFWKRKKKTEQKERDLNWIENFKIESRYLKLCYQSRAFIRCVKAAFYWPDYQNFSVCPLIKRLDRGFVLKNAVEPLKHSAELLTV